VAQRLLWPRFEFLLGKRRGAIGNLESSIKSIWPFMTQRD